MIESGRQPSSISHYYFDFRLSILSVFAEKKEQEIINSSVIVEYKVIDIFRVDV